MKDLLDDLPKRRSPEKADRALVEKVIKHFEYFTRSADRIEREKALSTISIDTKIAIEGVLRACLDMAKAAGIDPAAQRNWVESNFKGRDCLGNKYADYARTMGGSKEVAKFAYDTVDKEGDEYSFIKKLMGAGPLFGLVTASLYENAKKPDSEMNKKLEEADRPIDGWYPALIEEAAKTDRSIESFFGTLIDNIEKDEDYELLEPFLEDLKSQLQLYVMELINLANGFAIHIQKENCAVLYATCDFEPNGIPKGNTESGGKSEEFMKRLLDLQKHPVYQPAKKKGEADYSRIFSHLSGITPEKLKTRGTKIPVPVLVSVKDIIYLVDYFNRFWESMAHGLKKADNHFSNSTLGDSAQYIPVNHTMGSRNPGLIQLRAQPDEAGQARFGLLGQNQFKGFDLRLDLETPERLIMDIGSTKSEHALAYAETMGQISDREEIVMNYDKVLGKKNRNENAEYPSVTETEVKGPDKRNYTMGNKAALVAAVAMSNAQIHGLRTSEIYLHHANDKKIAKHAANFPQLMEKLAGVLLGKKSEK